MYTHKHIYSKRPCRILQWSVESCVVRSPSLYDQGEDEYDVPTVYLELLMKRHSFTEQIDEAFDLAFDGHLYGDEEKANAKAWFTKGFISGTDAR